MKRVTASATSRARARKGRVSGRELVFSNILVPTDFSPISLKALEYACALGTAFGAILHLLHVNDIDVEAPALAALFPPSRDIKTKLLHRLESIAAGVSAPTRGLCCHVRSGKAFNEVCQAARDLAADLIVTATHGYSGLQRILLGSTTERIVQHSPSPVLVLREHERDFVPSRRRKKTRDRRHVCLDRVLVPTDFSEHSRRALSYALAFAKHFGAEVILLNAIYPHYYATNPDYFSSDYGPLLDETRRLAKSDMAKLVRATSFGDVSFKTRIEEGHPVQNILEIAAEWGADLIVTSTHGRTGLAHVLIGSTAEQVVRYAKCPVLVIPRVKGNEGK
jgi:nucleotide-binding universal stress UspA family protein